MADQKTNPRLVSLVDDLREQAWEHDAPIWRDIADRLEKPRSRWAEVNLSGLDRNLESGSTVVVPGKVLGAGTLDVEATVAAFGFSGSAREKIEDAGGEAVAIRDLLESESEGSGVEVVG
jgi:large subunit ribosomal protein L18e